MHTPNTPSDSETWSWLIPLGTSPHEAILGKGENTGCPEDDTVCAGQNGA